MQAASSQHLTRRDMEAVIDAGGSVMFKGRIIAQKHVLPSEAELAAGNPALEQHAQALLTDEIKRLNDQLAALKDGTFQDKFGSRPIPDVGPSVLVSSPVNAPAPVVPDDLKSAQRAAVLAGAPAPHEIAPAPVPAVTTPVAQPTHPSETVHATPPAPAPAAAPEPPKAKKQT